MSFRPHAAFIADAVEVANATGLSPFQLKDQRDALAARVRALEDALRCHSAIEDMPLKKGEEVLRQLGWDGEQDIDKFIAEKRLAALGAERAT